MPIRLAAAAEELQGQLLVGGTGQGEIGQKSGMVPEE